MVIQYIFSLAPRKEMTQPNRGYGIDVTLISQQLFMSLALLHLLRCSGVGALEFLLMAYPLWDVGCESGFAGMRKWAIGNGCNNLELMTRWSYCATLLELESSLLKSQYLFHGEVSSPFHWPSLWDRWPINHKCLLRALHTSIFVISAKPKVNRNTTFNSVLLLQTYVSRSWRAMWTSAYLGIALLIYMSLHRFAFSVRLARQPCNVLLWWVAFCLLNWSNVLLSQVRFQKGLCNARPSDFGTIMQNRVVSCIRAMRVLTWT